MVLEEAQTGLGSLLCVTVDRNPGKGEFFSDPGPQTAAVFSSAAVSGDTSFSSSSFAPDALASEASAYAVGDPLRVRPLPAPPSVPPPRRPPERSAAPQTDGRLGALAWPTASASTACDPASLARFREEVPAGTGCVTEVSDLCTECTASSLDWTRLVCVPTAPARRGDAESPPHLRPLPQSRQTVRDAGVGDVSQRDHRPWLSHPRRRIPPTQRPPRKRGRLLHSLTPLAPAGAQTSVTQRSTADGSSTAVAPTSLGATAVDASGGDCECKNALLSAALTVTYNGAGAVVSAEASVEVANLAAAAGAGVGIPQQFSLTFADADGPAKEPEYNLFARSKSGNPGFRDGLPVVAGRVVTQGSGDAEKRAVQPLAAGLEVLAPREGGACPSGGSAQGQGTPVLFGFDAVVECGEELSAAQLKARCESGAVPPALEVNATRVGMFGNADPLRINQWLELDVASAGPGGTYTAASRRCSDLVDGVHYEFVVARVGQATSPQRKIVAARARYSTAAWALPQGATTAVLPLRATASFHLLGDSELEGFVPPTPPLLPELPQDLFFPFTTSAAPPRVAGPQAAAVLGAAAATVAALALA